MNGWKLIFTVVALQSSVILLAKASKAGSCFSSSFARSIGNILRGFVIVEMKVTTVIECKRKCVHISNCASLNILRNADGSYHCQLNSGLRENAASEQFVPHGAGEYYRPQEKKLCTDNGKTCDSVTRWQAFNNSYFQVVTTEMNFYDAMEHCRAEKGDLASFSSAEEQTFVQSLLESYLPPDMSYAWIGINDIAEEGVFVWTDGSPVTYTKFASGEPSNGAGREHCVIFSKSTGEYNDQPCEGHEKPFICETRDPFDA